MAGPTNNSEPNSFFKQHQGLVQWSHRNPLVKPAWSSLYRGPGLPLSYTGDINPPELVDADLIFDSVRQIVETRLGERLQQPNFGSRIFELIGEPLTPVFEYKVQQYLSDAVSMWEPRAQINGVSFAYQPNSVTVTYNIQIIKIGINAQSTFKVPRSM